ncbi:MAG: pseudouridine synthase [Lachnospirales bacterium]
MIRLDKFLCDCCIGTRSEVKKIVKKGFVTLNDKKITDSSVKIDEKCDIIKYKNNIVNYTKYFYIMLNKPSGVISATEDSKEKTVIDILPKEFQNIGLFPVGRLDKDTLGLLLLTNDGEFSHNTLSPKKHFNKTYDVEFEGTLPPNAEELFEKGIVLSDFVCKRAKLIIKGENEATVIISEGKYHQVKRMFLSLGCKVVKLKRIAFGEIKLDFNLKEGQCRMLNETEMEYIKKYCGK